MCKLLLSLNLTAFSPSTSTKTNERIRVISDGNRVEYKASVKKVTILTEVKVSEKITIRPQGSGHESINTN